jgi:hypothetical protein
VFTRILSPLRAREEPVVVSRLVLGVALVLVASIPRSAWAAAAVYGGAGAQCAGGSEGFNESGPYSALGLATVSGTVDAEQCFIDPEHPANGLSLSAGATAFASLYTGELSVVAIANGAGSLPLEPPLWTQGDGTAVLNDVVIVSAFEDPFSTIAGLVLRVEGTITGFGHVAAYLIRAPSETRGCVSTIPPGCACLPSDQGCTPGVTTPGPFSFELRLGAPVSSASPSFPLQASLVATAVHEGLADAGSTATLSIELPDGYTFTSESGVLLAPEPSATSLAVVALAALAARTAPVRRRGRSHPR